jgi:hypothetical protein
MRPLHRRTGCLVAANCSTTSGATLRKASKSTRGPMMRFVILAALAFDTVTVSAVVIPHQATVACSRACMNCCTP